jgi:hypothetical protein
MTRAADASHLKQVVGRPQAAKLLRAWAWWQLKVLAIACLTRCRSVSPQALRLPAQHARQQRRMPYPCAERTWRCTPCCCPGGCTCAVLLHNRLSAASATLLCSTAVLHYFALLAPLLAPLLCSAFPFLCHRPTSHRVPRTLRVGCYGLRNLATPASKRYALIHKVG